MRSTGGSSFNFGRFIGGFFLFCVPFSSRFRFVPLAAKIKIIHFVIEYFNNLKTINYSIITANACCYRLRCS